MAAVHEIPFEFSELWRIAGVRKSLAQNWTNGRPLRLRPSVAAGEGKGSRNLYNIYDAYLLAYLAELKTKGISTDVLDRIADLLTLRIKGMAPLLPRYFGGEERWLGIAVSRQSLKTLGLTVDDQGHLQIGPFHPDEFRDGIGHILVLDVASLREKVDANARRVLRRKVYTENASDPTEPSAPKADQ
jgi:hypothetical protein